VFQTKRVVLFGDCDPAGAVYTPRIAHYVVEADLEFLTHALGSPAERSLMEQAILPPARALNLEFLSPMVWDDEITVSVSVLGLGQHSFTLQFAGRNQHDIETFRGTITHVCVSSQTKRPIDLPPVLRDCLASHSVGQASSSDLPAAPEQGGG